MNATSDVAGVVRVFLHRVAEFPEVYIRTYQNKICIRRFV